MKTEDVNGKTLETWTPEEVAQGLRDEKIVLIDVRTPQEYMFESIEDALLAPMSHISSKALPAGLGKHVVLYCGSGMRSRKAAEICLAKKFDKIAHLDGGFAAWKNAGLPYLGTNMSTGAPEVKTA
ncbi:rhodanese-like domain-containing protein [Maritimibacter sp. DP07]|uniref:Rhodanese-like domain-containing protein n=1 Tax=Maritimibacter harenae TaxID=2606218 RepID=A0A845MBK7_9RHOB|nr:rhodanese-like domain-containing protein [Maritimibacter harenae]MZR14751.1 rhodanese-like domain-containing protein [Maritimibacter harenae]